MAVTGMLDVYTVLIYVASGTYSTVYSFVGWGLPVLLLEQNMDWL